MGKSILFGEILQTEQTMTIMMMMMKSCSPVMIVGITPSENLTRVVQDVGPNSLMRMRMRTITRNPHLAEVALQAVALEAPLHVVQVVVLVDPPEVHPVVRVAALPVEVPAAAPPVEALAVALPVEVPAVALPVEVPRVVPRSVRAHHVD